MKHNKIKNVGLIFEILCKQIVYETLNPTKPQQAIKIIRRHFKNGSPLLQELRLYQQLSQHVDNVNVEELFGLIVENRKQINSSELNTQKYNLVKDIRKNYDLTEFFSGRVSNYKLLASIYNLFEFSSSKNPTKYLQNKTVILEFLSNKTPISTDLEVEEILLKEDEDVRKLGFKLIVEKFNDKYKNLNPSQRKLLSKYINEDSSSTEFKDYIVLECSKMTNRFEDFIEKETDPIVKIKLTEVTNLLENIVISDKLKEEHLSAMLKYYELIDEMA